MKKQLIAFITISLLALSCSSLQIPRASQIDAAAIIGCTAMEFAGCFESVQKVFPGIDAQSCAERIRYLADVAVIAPDGMPDVDDALLILNNVDLEKFDPENLRRLRGADCKKASDALGIR